MADTIRETIIKDFLTRGAVITTANGYNTNIGANAFRARKTIDPDELPASVLWPGAEKAENQYGVSACTMQLKIEGIAVHGLTNPSVVSEQILGDLKKCFLSQYDTTTSPPTGWNRSAYIDGIVYAGGGLDEYPDEGQLTVGAYINLEVTYHTKLDDPYAQ
jgi:hypothetical protein